MACSCLFLTQTQTPSSLIVFCAVMFDSYNIVGDIIFPEIPTGPEAEADIEVGLLCSCAAMLCLNCCVYMLRLHCVFCMML